jgi:DNA polymerase III psi subunit
MIPAIVIPDEAIISKIYFIRGHKVLLDKDLAILYQVGTRDLNKAVKRNLERFPEDFMFQLTKKEVTDLMFQTGTSSWGGNRKLPNAFTEQGMAMLSSVLHSDLAIQVHIRIIRVFTKIRSLLETHQNILKRLMLLEKNDENQENKILLIPYYLKSFNLRLAKVNWFAPYRIILLMIRHKPPIMFSALSCSFSSSITETPFCNGKTIVSLLASAPRSFAMSFICHAFSAMKIRSTSPMVLMLSVAFTGSTLKSP